MVVRRVSEACIVYTLLVRLYELKGPSAQNPYSLRDQLDRADAGSWQIADGGDLRTAHARAQAARLCGVAGCAWVGGERPRASLSTSAKSTS